MDRLFAAAEAGLDVGGESGMGPAAAPTVALWIQAVASMRPDELQSFTHRTFAMWDRGSLGDLTRAIERSRERKQRSVSGSVTATSQPRRTICRGAVRALPIRASPAR